MRRAWSVEASGQQFKGERDVPQPLPSGAQQILSGHSECLEENREKLRGKVPASEADLAQAARSIWEELHPKEQLQYSAVDCGLMSFKPGSLINTLGRTLQGYRIRGRGF